MNDTISRREAIDAIMSDKIEGNALSIIVALGDGKQAETLNEACDRHAQLLNDLPSAQPEVIRCKDCKHYNAGFECLIEGYGIERNKNWYCADAERRTDEAD